MLLSFQITHLPSHSQLLFLHLSFLLFLLQWLLFLQVYVYFNFKFQNQPLIWVHLMLQRLETVEKFWFLLLIWWKILPFVFPTNIQMLYWLRLCFCMFIFSGIQTGSDEQSRVDSHHKMIVALVVPCSALGAIILFLLCFWLYHLKCTHKSSKKNAKNPGTYFLYRLYFPLYFCDLLIWVLFFVLVLLVYTWRCWEWSCIISIFGQIQFCKNG